VIPPRRNALHQGMPGRVEFDRVDALALNVEAMQHRWIAVGEAGVFEVRLRAECRPGARELWDGCARTLTLNRLLQA